MFSIEGTAGRLRESLETIEWAVGQLPEPWHHAVPDFYAEGEWHAAMNLAHLTVYEEQLANPVLEALARGEDGVGSVRSGMESWFYGDSVAASGEPLAALMDRFRTAREREIGIVESFAKERFNEPVCPLWGGTGRHGAALQPAGWVATKTFQHSWEHGNALLRLALFVPR